MSEKEETADSGSRDLFSPEILRLLTGLAALYFVFRLIYFVIAVHHSDPPDEITHFGRVVYFSKFFLLPGGGSVEGETHLWASRYHPPLYYLLAGKFMLLNVFGADEIAFARLFSVILSGLTVFYGWRLVKVISPNPLVHFLFVIMLTNTLMFSFLSAAITYDSLANLLAAAAFYYMTCYLKKKEPGALLSLLLVLFLATLTKVTMLPFCFAVVVGVLIVNGRNLKREFAGFGVFWSQSRVVPKLLYGAVALSFCLNLFLYGNNLWRFGHLVPQPAQVMDASDVKSHPMAARSTIYVGYLQGEIELEEALERARAIEDKASSLDTVNLLNYGAWRKENEGPFEPMSRMAYAIPWSKTMFYSTFGVMGHSVLYKTFRGDIFLGNLPYLLLFMAAAVLFIIRGGQGRAASHEYLYIGLFIFYALVLMQAVNYSAYLKFQLSHISVQGRYLFPFLIPVYGLAATYLLSFGSKRVQSVVAVGIALFYVYGDFPFFLREWGSGPW
jgi:hypothetical protein